MITNRIWNKRVSGEHGKYKIETWRGWFLFNFIPLYLKITNVIYYNCKSDWRK